MIHCGNWSGGDKSGAALRLSCVKKRLLNKYILSTTAASSKNVGWVGFFWQAFAVTWEGFHTLPTTGTVVEIDTDITRIAIPRLQAERENHSEV